MFWQEKNILPKTFEEFRLTWECLWLHRACWEINNHPHSHDLKSAGPSHLPQCLSPEPRCASSTGHLFADTGLNDCSGIKEPQLQLPSWPDSPPLPSTHTCNMVITAFSPQQNSIKFCKPLPKGVLFINVFSGRKYEQSLLWEMQ